MSWWHLLNRLSGFSDPRAGGRCGARFPPAGSAKLPAERRRRVSLLMVARPVGTGAGKTRRPIPWEHMPVGAASLCPGRSGTGPLLALFLMIRSVGDSLERLPAGGGSSRQPQQPSRRTAPERMPSARPPPDESLGRGAGRGTCAGASRSPKRLPPARFP